MKTTLREVRKGEYFTFKDIEEPKESQVYVRDEYDRSAKKFGYSRFSDYNHYNMKKGSTVVYTGFTF